MRPLRALAHRLGGLFGRDRRERELAEELQLHRDLYSEELVRGGLGPAEARRQAAIALGGIEAAKEAVRARRGLPLVETLLQDLRYALRGLARQPGFAAFVVLSLALGIGANTVVFSVLDAMLLRPLPYRQGERVMTLRKNQSGPDLDDIRARSRSFSAVAGIAVQPLTYTGGGEPIQLQAGICTGPFAAALGVKPALGRWWRADEDRVGAVPVVVLADGLWRRVFGGDRALLGRSIVLSGKSYLVIGVMPRNFWLPGSPRDLWASANVVDPSAANFRGVHFLKSYLRLAPGVPLAAARAEMKVIDAWLEQRYPIDNHGRRSELISMRERVVGDTRTPLAILAATAGCVLLIACVNFANLLLARGAARRRELVIRSALGAGTRRLRQQLLTEAMLLALLGGAAGLVLAWRGLALLAPLVPARLTQAPAVALDGRVLLFTLAASICTGLLFGLVPALVGARLELGEELKAAGRTVTGDRRGLRLRRCFVVSEYALAFILLVGAGLILRSFLALESVSPGFRDDDILTARLELPQASYPDLPAERRFRQALLASLNALPDTAAGLVSELPLGGEELTHHFVIEGAPPIEKGAEPQVETRTVSPRYFSILGIPIVRGRAFDEHDGATSPTVAAVNEAFVRQHLGRRPPLGVRVAWANEEPPPWMTIVAVVGDVKHFGLGLPEKPAIYDLYSQTYVPWKRWMDIVLRGGGGPTALLARLRRAVATLDRGLPLTRVETLHAVVDSSIAESRFRVVLLGLFAAVAIALAANGIYGVTAYAVAQDAHAIGVRMALGAQRAAILRQVLGQGGRLALLGWVVGLGGAQVLALRMASLLFGVGALDPLTLVAVTAVLGVVALLGCWIPARAATRVDPISLLRSD
jgi:putative ABC transport system permease protein